MNGKRWARWLRFSSRPALPRIRGGGQTGFSSYTDAMLTSAILLCALMLGPAHAQNTSTYPTRPIRIVTGEPSGGNDFAARLIAQDFTRRLGQQVVVENRGAASGAISAEIVAKAAPDGHTLLYYNQTIWLLPYLRAKVPYDPLRDFAPVSLVMRGPFALFVNPGLPAKNVKELIALAAARPGELNYGSAGSGATTHLSAELFKFMTGVNLVRVPYKGTAAAVNGLMGGEVHVMFFPVFIGLPHTKSGKLRALAVTTLEPSPLAPTLPTVASVLPGYEVLSLSGMFAPARTPPALVRRISVEIAQVLAAAEIRDHFERAGAQPVGSVPDEFGALVKSEMAKWSKVIKTAGIQEE